MSKRMLKLLPKINIVIIVLSIIICSIYTIVYLIKQDYVLMALSALVIFLPFLIYIVDRVLKQGIPIVVKTAYLLFLFLSAVLGGVANFYEQVPLYDKIIHFASGILVSWLFAVAFISLNKKYDIKVLIFSLTCFNATTAVFWEICEFTFDTIFKKHVQRGNTDTMTDMIVAIAGSILVALVYIDNKKKLR